ncbi:acyltransferase family protein [Planctomicrobium piriforme]|uniref:Fucose 4-O-acetylase n=1 Tax=Planctomicrobium piriforme TaxID=1576369 RepID=A0A1I3DI33_9PLAN|nr:acyltransferase family protein [Planctomicrobium piriforme]SFH86385.1 Fucose 4-O-acetylase [Planctomicrobium piriforme]
MPGQNSSVTAVLPLRAARPRLLGLDWLRAMGAVLVVVLHAGMPYLTRPFPGLIWSASSPQKSELLNAICWGIDGFIMPLFFLMTGYFAAQLFTQRGANGFLQHRLQRIGGPLVFAFFAIMPFDLYIWMFGWVGEDLIPFQKILSLKLPPHLGASLWGVGHLWYLECVLTYCLAAWLIFQIRRQLFRTEVKYSFDWNRLPIANGLITLTAGIIIAGVTLWWQPRIVIGFRHGWLPYWENLMYYAVPFALGWCWRQQSERMPITPWRAASHLVLAGLALVCLQPLLDAHLNDETQPAASLATPVLFAAYGLLMSTGFFGLALTFQPQRVPTIVTRLSQASFWIYLVHHPLVGLLHVDLKLMDWSPELECLITTLVSLGLSLAMYEVLVRRTWVGQLLNGYREPPLSVRKQAAPMEFAAERRAA